MSRYVPLWDSTQYPLAKPLRHDLCAAGSEHYHGLYQEHGTHGAQIHHIVAAHK